jgi:type III pantothenate kinase
VLLCIDIGNTNTVLATFDGDRLVHSWRIKTDAHSTGDELGLLYRGLLASDAVEITGVCACSTVPAALRSLRSMLARYYASVPTLIVEPGVKTGVQLAIDNPKEVGTDRQHPGRIHDLRRTVHCGGCGHHDDVRRHQREG